MPRENMATSLGLRFLHFRTYLISNPDDIEDVLVNHPRKFVKGRVLQANKRLFGNGLLTSEGDFWLRQRRLAQPAFHRTRIASYAETMVQYTEKMLERWKDGEERDAHQEMMQLTLQIVGKTLFDADVAGDAQEIGRTITLLLDFSSDFRRLIFTPKWLPTPRNIQYDIGNPAPEQDCVSHDRRPARFRTRRWRFAVDAADRAG